MLEAPLELEVTWQGTEVTGDCRTWAKHSSPPPKKYLGGMFDFVLSRNL